MAAQYSPGLQLVAAGAPSLVRSNQKDLYYSSVLHSLISDVCKSLCSPRRWLLWQRELRLLAELTYFGATTLLNRQTLGEEYSNIIQAGVRLNEFEKYKTPSFARRLLSVVLQVICPYVLEKVLHRMNTWVDSVDIENSNAPPVLKNLSPSNRQRLSKVLSALSIGVSLVSQLHMASFYYFGSYYHVAKRLCSIAYAQIIPKNHSHGRSGHYSFLGLLVSIQIVIQMASYASVILDALSPTYSKPLTSTVAPSSAPSPGMEPGSRSDSEEQLALGLQCMLCLDAVAAPAAVSCGHLFCWDCIMAWCAQHRECPVCRSSAEPRHIVLLQNFSV